MSNNMTSPLATERTSQPRDLSATHPLPNKQREDDESPTGVMGRTPLRDLDAIRTLLWTEGREYKVSDPDSPRPRNALTWDEFFLGVALLTSKRSQQHNPCGACLVDGSTHRIVSVGYNGLPVGCEGYCFPVAGEEFLHRPETYTVHACLNALLNRHTHRRTTTTAHLELYTTHYPCAECSKAIVQSTDICKVHYLLDSSNDQDDPQVRASRIILTLAGVQVAPVRLDRPEIVLDFGSATANERTGAVGDETPSNVLAPSVLTPEEKERQHAVRDVFLKEANFDPVTTPRYSNIREVLSWDDYFMAMALLTAKRSKDPNTQVGACVVNPVTRHIISTGYNGFPHDCSDKHLPWNRASSDPLHTKYAYVCHAELNAILPVTCRGAVLYVALFPCGSCAKIIIQAGIRRVVYLHDKYHETDTCRASRILLHAAGVETVCHSTTTQEICLSMLVE